MRTKAAIIRQARQDWEVVDVDLAATREVRQSLPVLADRRLSIGPCTGDAHARARRR